MSGQIKFREHVVDGIESFVELGLYDGDEVMDIGVGFKAAEGRDLHAERFGDS